MSKNKVLNVPIFRQGFDTPHCGPACAQMNLAYYGIRKELQSIVKTMDIDPGGAYLPSLGSYFLDQNLETTLLVWDYEFPPTFRDMDTRRLNQELRDWCLQKIETRLVMKPTVKFAKSLLAFMKNGGEVRARWASAKDFQEAIDNRIPPIMRVSATQLRGTGQTCLNWHYIVLRGFSNNVSIINDPDPTEYGGKKVYSTDKLMHSYYGSSNGAILAKPR